ncbi:hypothetical protein FRB94_007055 [Tulasnella sp. JGI-2019a]|nr:hypothetical protein FRB94_007055 [Tulasnella sp. JGI-2019a]KAG9016966.1 hypothetical protein FRB93_009496 [Tulasnella sp. JGI-2019a]
MDGLDGVKGYLTASFIGIIVAICGNIIISFALNCQKLAHKRLEEGRSGDNTPKGEEEDHADGGGNYAANQSPAAVTDTSPLLFRPNHPTRSYTDPVTRSSPAPLLYTLQPISTGSPLSSPTKRRQPSMSPAVSRASAQTNMSSAVADIPEESESGSDTTPRDHRGATAANRGSSPSRKTSGRERAISWGVDHNGPGPPPKPKSSSSKNSNSRGRFHSGVDETGYLKSRLWWIGLLLLNVGEFGNFLSYAFAPASVVAPLGSFALVANCFFAPFMLNERFRKQDLLGVFIAILGAVTVVSAAKSKEVRLDPVGLLAAIKRIPFIIYTSLSVITGSILAFLSERSAGQEFVYVDVGLCAVFGGYTVLATKAISTLLSLRGLEIFAEPITYPILVVLAATGLGQIKYLNRALMSFDSKVVIPTQFVLFTLSAIIGSAVLYHDFAEMPFHRFIVFGYGCLTTFLGVYLLTREDRPLSPTEDLEELSPSRSSTPTLQRGRYNFDNFATTFTPLLTPRTIRISDGQGLPALSGKSSRASLAISPGYLLLATSAAGPDGTPPPHMTLQQGEGGNRRRTRSESQTRTQLVSGSLESGSSVELGARVRSSQWKQPQGRENIHPPEGRRP